MLGLVNACSGCCTRLCAGSCKLPHALAPAQRSAPLALLTLQIPRYKVKQELLKKRLACQIQGHCREDKYWWLI